MNNKGFSVPFHWNTAVWLLTAFSVVPIALLWFIAEYSDAIAWQKYLFTAVILLTYILAVGFMPKRLELSDSEVAMHRLFGSLRIPMNAIVECEKISKAHLDGSVKICGSGGFLGYYGKYRNKRYGVYTVNVTEFNNLILIRTESKTYVFSCTQRDKVVEYIKSNMK